MRTISMIRTNGNSLVITVPKAWVDYLELREGSIIEWELHNEKKIEVEQ